MLIIERQILKPQNLGERLEDLIVNDLEVKRLNLERGTMADLGSLAEADHDQSF